MIGEEVGVAELGNKEGDMLGARVGFGIVGDNDGDDDNGPDVGIVDGASVGSLVIHN